MFKQGARASKYYDNAKRKRRSRAETRVGCGALFRVRYDRGMGKYVVTHLTMNTIIPWHHHTVSLSYGHIGLGQGCNKTLFSKLICLVKLVVESAFLQEPGLKLAGPVEAQACFVSVVHLLVGAVYCLFSWAFGLPKRVPIDKEQLALLTPVAFCHALGHVMSNVSFAAVAVSLTHTIKDPFADANDSVVVEKFIHIRNQQRNGKKSLTTVQGLKEELSLEKILKDLKEFCCNGNVGQNEELGKVIQLQGDQRKNVSNFLVKAGLAKKEEIKMHGF